MSGKPGQIAGKWMYHCPAFKPPAQAARMMTATPGKLSYWVKRETQA